MYSYTYYFCERTENFLIIRVFTSNILKTLKNKNLRKSYTDVNQWANQTGLRVNTRTVEGI